MSGSFANESFPGKPGIAQTPPDPLQRDQMHPFAGVKPLDKHLFVSCVFRWNPEELAWNKVTPSKITEAGDGYMQSFKPSLAAWYDHREAAFWYDLWREAQPDYEWAVVRWKIEVEIAVNPIKGPVASYTTDAVVEMPEAYKEDNAQ
jgi:hypothetical protein